MPKEGAPASVRQVIDRIPGICCATITEASKKKFSSGGDIDPRDFATALGTDGSIVVFDGIGTCLGAVERKSGKLAYSFVTAGLS
jgi:hypothetical protein